MACSALSFLPRVPLGTVLRWSALARLPALAAARATKGRATMARNRRILSCGAALVAGLTAAAPAARADDEKPPEASGSYEDPHKAYTFIGLRFRDVIVQKFMVGVSPTAAPR